MALAEYALDSERHVGQGIRSQALSSAEVLNLLVASREGMPMNLDPFLRQID
jgi:hypothetical protein